MINRHFPMLWPFGITPKRFICRGGRDDSSGDGPSIRLRCSSFWRYSPITPGCCTAEYMFFTADLMGARQSKPMRKPWRRPRRRYRTNALSAWDARAASHTSGRNGVDIPPSSGEWRSPSGRAKSRHSRSPVYLDQPTSTEKTDTVVSLQFMVGLPGGGHHTPWVELLI